MPIKYSWDYTLENIHSAKIEEDKLFDKWKDGRREKMLMLHQIAHEYYQEREKHDQYNSVLEHLLPENIRIWFETFMTLMAHVNTDKKLVTEDWDRTEWRLNLRKLTLENKKLSDFSESELSELELVLSGYSGEWRMKEAEMWDFLEEKFAHLGKDRIFHIGNFFQNFQGKPNPEFWRTIREWIGDDAFEFCSQIKIERIEILRKCVRDVYVFALGDDYIKDYPLVKPYAETKGDNENLLSSSKRRMRDLRKKYNQFWGILLADHPDLSHAMVQDTQTVYNFMVLDVLSSVNKKRVLFNKGLLLELQNTATWNWDNPTPEDLKKTLFISEMVKKQTKIKWSVSQLGEVLHGENLEELIRILWANYKMAKLAAEYK